MGADCCGSTPVFEGLSADYKRRLWAVIAINATMFFVEMGAGAFAGSQALQADALDFLGDTLTYGISLAVIGSALRVRAWAAFAKALSLTLMGLWVLGATAYHVLVLGVPRAEIMGVVGFLALAANVASVLLLVEIQGRRRQCALGVAVLAQRRHRQRGGHGRGGRGLGDRDQVAGPDRRGDHGRTVPHVVGARSSSRRSPSCAAGQRHPAMSLLEHRHSATQGESGQGWACSLQPRSRRRWRCAASRCCCGVGRLAAAGAGVPDRVAVAAADDLCVRLPIDGLLRTTFGISAGWVTIVVAVLRAADRGAGQVAHRGGAEGAAARSSRIRSSSRSPPALGFGIGEIWFLAHALIKSPSYPDLPFWMFGGFMIERLAVCFLHGAFLVPPFYALAAGRSFLLGGLAGMVLHFLLNFPIYLASINAAWARRDLEAAVAAVDSVCSSCWARSWLLSRRPLPRQVAEQNSASSKSSGPTPP